MKRKTNSVSNHKQKKKNIKVLRDHGPQKMKLSKILNESRIGWRRNGRRRNSNSNVLGCRDVGDAVYPLSPTLTRMLKKDITVNFGGT